MVTIRSSEHGRSDVSSKTKLRGRSPTNCCSVASRRAAPRWLTSKTTNSASHTRKRANRRLRTPDREARQLRILTFEGGSQAALSFFPDAAVVKDDRAGA